MQILRASIVFCFWAMVCNAQTANTDQALLSQIRGKYDAPFDRSMQSFNCAVDFSWKDHFKETLRVGDEGTDEELETVFQPIRHHVEVTRQSVTITSGLSESEIDKLPHGGMAERLLEHAIQKSLYTWLPASTNAIVPDAAPPASIVQTSSGYKLAIKMQNSDVEMAFDPDMRLQSAGLKADPSSHVETSFSPGAQGFLLASWTVGEGGNPEQGHRLTFSYTYQSVDGVALPEHVVVNRESHHEVWRYRLTNCSVKTSK